MTPQTIRFLRSTPAETLIEEYSSYTSTQFDVHGVPVIIAARNEQNDLPATLLTLAHNKDPVWPIVVENGSTDDTAGVARRMGATVLQSEIGYKMAALQTGVKLLDTDHRLTTPILFGDADTLYGLYWARIMTRQAQSAVPCVASSLSVAWHGERKLVDAARSANLIMRDIRNTAGKKRPAIRGNTMALQFANDTDLTQAYNDLDSKIFVGEEQAVSDVVLANGGSLKGIIDPRAMVVTRGDRFNSLALCLKLSRERSIKERAALYVNAYGPGFHVYHHGEVVSASSLLGTETET